MIKKFCIVSLFATLLFLMVGCSAVVSSEEYFDEVTVENVHYSPSWSQPMTVGKTTTYITHPASYNVKLSYGENNQFKKTIDNSKLYRQCKGKIGETLKAKFVKTTYEDGTTKIRFIELTE